MFFCCVKSRIGHQGIKHSKRQKDFSQVIIFMQFLRPKSENKLSSYLTSCHQLGGGREGSCQKSWVGKGYRIDWTIPSCFISVTETVKKYILITMSCPCEKKNQSRQRIGNLGKTTGTGTDRVIKKSIQCCGSKYIEFGSGIQDPEFQRNLDPDPGLCYQ